MKADWDGIIDREGPAVWRTVCRLLSNRADAEECFQETFLAALELWRRQHVRDERAALRRLATARAIDRLRRRYREGKGAGEMGGTPLDRMARDRTRLDRSPLNRAVLDRTALDRSPRPPDRAAASELAEQLRVALAELPGDQAEVFGLHCLDGLSYREVADALGVSVDNVGVLLHRARAKLRVALADRAPAAREVTR